MENIDSSGENINARNVQVFSHTSINNPPAKVNSQIVSIFFLLGAILSIICFIFLTRAKISKNKSQRSKHLFLKKIFLTSIGVFSILFFAAIFYSMNANTPSFASSTNVALPQLPNKWPTTLGLGMASDWGQAAAEKATTNFQYRYKYLTGAFDTCQWCAWPTWGTSNGTSKTGDYMLGFTKESVDNGMIPVFTYYNILSLSNYSEGNGEIAALNDATKMNKYFTDVKLFMTFAAQYPNNMIVMHFEPDLWGYIQQHATNDDATTVPAQISTTGLPELAGLPNNAAGFAQAIIKMRNTYAPNVVLGYHMSGWGTGTDIVYGTPTSSTIASLATRSGNFYKSLNAPFDLSFTDASDRDAAFYQYQYNNPNVWWDSADYANSIAYISTYTQIAGNRMVIWQIPFGNQKMLTENNTYNHYEDNHVETLIGSTYTQTLQDYANAGVAALLFGRGAGGNSGPSDDNNDGVTNPAPITYQGATTSIKSILASQGTTPALSTDGLTLTTPYAADDDGGYFRWRAYEYYKSGALVLPQGSITATSTPTSSLSPTLTPTTINTPTPVPPTSTPSPTPIITNDTTVPTVSILKPANNATLSKNGNTAIYATASDASGIYSIKIAIDSIVKKTCLNTTTCSISIKNQSLNRGQHTISVSAVDNSANKNVGTASVVVYR